MSSDEKGSRPLDNPEDLVRVGIGTALRRGILVIPVLADGALMPRSTDLPAGLKPLAHWNALWKLFTEVEHPTTYARYRTCRRR
jgi:hypothetical protein